MSTSVNLQKFFTRFPVMHLGDIVLRDLMVSDKNEYLAMMLDPEVNKYMSDEDVPTTLEEAEREIKFWGGLFYRKQSVFWAIADAQTDKLIGTIGFNMWNVHNGRTEVSYDVIKSHWRKGIATKALNNVLMFAFRYMNMTRIEARTMMENIPSQNLLLKVGFKHEGVLRKYRIIRGQPEDVMLFSITNADFSSGILGASNS